MSKRTKGIDLEAMQAAIVDEGVDGWLFAQFRGSDPIADLVLGFEGEGLQTRRWFYFVPAEGEPRGLVHAIEPHELDGLPGSKQTYLEWERLEAAIGGLVDGADRVAMQYSPNNRIPYVSIVDAGTVELVRGHGVEVVSSAELVQRFTATLSDAQIDSHDEAAGALPGIVRSAFRRVREAIERGETLTEHALQQFILRRIEEEGFVTEEAPIVGVNEHAADPHYSPDAEGSAPIREGDWLLLDQWCRRPQPWAVWADITWCGQVGAEIPADRGAVWDVVRRARDAAVALIIDRYEAGEPVAGHEADRAARDVIEAAGHGAAFRHRTGHSITTALHGTGANLDDLETHDSRRLARRCCFSVEPGVYLDSFGVRSEVDMLIPPEGLPRVTGEQQDEPIAVLHPDAPI